jgi:hypothetical protein
MLRQINDKARPARKPPSQQSSLAPDVEPSSPSFPFRVPKPSSRTEGSFPNPPPSNRPNPNPSSTNRRNEIEESRIQPCPLRQTRPPPLSLLASSLSNAQHRDALPPRLASSSALSTTSRSTLSLLAGFSLPPLLVNSFPSVARNASSFRPTPAAVVPFSPLDSARSLAYTPFIPLSSELNRPGHRLNDLLQRCSRPRSHPRSPHSAFPRQRSLRLPLLSLPPAPPSDPLNETPVPFPERERPRSNAPSPSPSPSLEASSSRRPSSRPRPRSPPSPRGVLRRAKTRGQETASAGAEEGGKWSEGTGTAA